MLRWDCNFCWFNDVFKALEYTTMDGRCISDKCLAVDVGGNSCGMIVIVTASVGLPVLTAVDIKITLLRNVASRSLVNKYSCSGLNLPSVCSEFPEDVCSIFFSRNVSVYHQTEWRLTPTHFNIILEFYSVGLRLTNKAVKNNRYLGRDWDT
jgi:hypothetical protein